MNDSQTTNQYTYSMSGILRNLLRYSWVILLFAGLFLSSGILFKVGFAFDNPIFQLVSFLSVISVLAGIVIKAKSKNWIGALVIDFEKRIILISTIFGNRRFEFALDEVLNIYVNGYIHLIFKQARFYLNDLTNRNLFINLNRVKSIEWGPACKIWGPPKVFRDELGSMS